MKTNPKIFLNKGVRAWCASFGSTFTEGVLRTYLNPYPHGNSYIREVCNWNVLTATLEKLRLYM